MKQKHQLSPLAEAELETEKEMKEWGRQRLKKKLQKISDEQGEFSPLKR